MLPPMLTARPGPQTLLLTALALLIVAATIMLACGPVAQPIPDAGDTLAAAPQAEGSGEEPAAEPEEPTATPTPTPEPNIGTDDLDTGDSMQNSGSGGSMDIPPPPPIPTLKYPDLEHTLDELAIAADNAGGGVDGQSESATDNFVRVSIWMDTNPDAAATKALVEWLKARGISSSVYGRTEGYGDGSFISARVPTRLLGAISQQEGVGRVKDARGHVPDPRPIPTR